MSLRPPDPPPLDRILLAPPLWADLVLAALLIAGVAAIVGAVL
jgi:hypothetical protein